MGSAVRRTRWPATRRAAGRAGAGIALSVVLGVAAGCTDTTLPPPDERPSNTPDTPATSTGPVRPDPNFEPPPHTEAGEDLLSTFPSPADLGAGWAYLDAVDKDPDPGGPEVGTERDGNDVLDGSVPQECPRLNPLPLPRAAAEVRYLVDGVPVSAFAVSFESRAVTRAFLTLLVANLEDCQGEQADDGGDLVGQVVPLGDGIVLADRFPDDPDARRTDLAILTDRSVVLLEAPVVLGAEPFTSRPSLRAAEAFREAVLDAPAWARRPD